MIMHIAVVKTAPQASQLYNVRYLPDRTRATPSAKRYDVLKTKGSREKKGGLHYFKNRFVMRVSVYCAHFLERNDKFTCCC